VAYFSTDTTQAESASTPVTVSDWGPGGGVWEHYEERQVSYGLLFEIFDELDISGINSGSAMAELRAELGRRGIRMWLPRSVVTHVFEIWCKVDRQFPRDPDDLGRWRVPYGLLFAIFEDLELRELEFGVALRQVREELPRRNLPYELPRRYIIRALRLWRAVQLEMVEELEERLEERVRERIERSEDIEDALRTEDRERKEEEREERGETKPAERQDATVDAIPDIEDGTKHEVIFAVFARIEEMGINIDSPAGGFRGLNDLVNDLLAARGGRRARDVVLNAARARYRQQRRNSPSDS